MSGELQIDAPGVHAAGKRFTVSVDLVHGRAMSRVKVTLAHHERAGSLADRTLATRTVSLAGDGTGSARFATVSIDQPGRATLIATARDVKDDDYYFKPAAASVVIR